MACGQPLEGGRGMSAALPDHLKSLALSIAALLPTDPEQRAFVLQLVNDLHAAVYPARSKTLGPPPPAPQPNPPLRV